MPSHGVDKENGTLWVPPCDTRGLFFDSEGRRAERPSSLRSHSSRLDEAAVLSVLELGAIVPPRSPWSGIQRFMPGYRYRGTDPIELLQLPCKPEWRDLDPDAQADAVESLIDAAIRAAVGDREDPVLLFSGGVDSGLIACRLEALGYSDSLLINYSFGREDQESLLAEEMARHLGLRYERVTARSSLVDCLTTPGRIYPQPFGDPSTVPTSDLAHAVVEHLGGRPRLILDGIGADGAFGMGGKAKTWNRVMRIPTLVQRAASWAYGATLWHRQSRLERTLRILRRAAILPLPAAALAHNGLRSCLFDGDGAVHDELTTWVAGWAGDSTERQIVAGDLALTCANTFAQKAQPILEAAGHCVRYPFLEDGIVGLALEALDHWRMQEPKAPLKRALARRVPMKMVYREKSAFLDPRGAVFHDDRFLEYLDSATEASGPISAFLLPRTVRRACDLLAARKPLPAQTRNCLWTIVFLDRWCRTVPEVAEAEGDTRA